jgi:hypothetical protein
MGYNAPVTSTTVAGIGLPMNLCDAKPQTLSRSLCGFLHSWPLLAAQMWGRKAAGSRQRFPVDQPVWAAAPIGLGATVLTTEPLEANMANLIRRDFRCGPAPLTALPFVADVKTAPRKKRRSFWNVPQTDDYGTACDMGRQYAGDFLQYIKDNPYLAGSNILGQIVQDMAAHPRGTDMHGYEVGFWSAIETLLYRAVTRENHWDVLQQVQDNYDAIAEAREAEEPQLEGADA